MANIEHSKRTEHREIPLLERYRGRVDTDMKGLLAATEGAPARMIEYHLGFRDEKSRLVPGGKSDGKAIRPTLTLLTVDATGGDWQKAVPAGSAIEMFHNFTLIHDDIEDRDQERHGKPTVWKLRGEEQAINAGDAAHFLSTEALLRLEDNGYDAKTVLEAQRLLTGAGHQLARGQAQDMAFENRLDVTVDEYLDMIGGKTGILLETSIAMGALLGHADEETTSHLREYGKSSGLAFQLIDDALGIWGDPQKTGKPVGADIRRRKKSYPIVLAFDQAEGITRVKLNEIYTKKEKVNDTDVEDVYQILEDLDCQTYTKNMAAAALGRATDTIFSANIDPELKGDYVGLLKKFATRQH